jgi:hypothetical protein
LDHLEPEEREELRVYILRGAPPRSRFLSGLLTGDAETALIEGGARKMIQTAVVFAAILPGESWGCPEAVEEWSLAGGMKGES